MPPKIQGAYEGEGGRIEVGKDLKYTYPLRNDWSPGSDLTRKTLGRLNKLMQDSTSAMQSRHTVADEIDTQLNTKIILDDDQQEIKDEDKRKPVGIVIPMLAIILDTLIAHTLHSYLGQALFRFRPEKPSDRIPAMLYELAVQKHMEQFKGLLALLSASRDSYAYGLGILTPTWKVHRGVRFEKEERPVVDPLTGATVAMTSDIREVKNAVLREGNALECVPFRDFRPDPNVPHDQVQEGEFVGWYNKYNRTKLLMMEVEEPDSIFNVRYLRKGTNHRSKYTTQRTTQISAVGHRDNENIGITDEVDVAYIYVRLIPSEWGVGKSELPELWLFAVAGDELIIRAAPANLNHNMFPVGVISYMADSQSVAPISKLELIYEIAIAANYGYSSMLEEMRKSMKNRFLIDPMLARYDDATSEDHSQLIRMREGAWGRGVQNAIQQLEVTNVTKDNMQHINAFMDMAFNATGATEAMQGVMRKRGERTTATEFRDTRLSAIGRVEKDLIVASLQAMNDLGFMIYKHTQQFKSRDVFVDFVGEHARELMAHYGASGTYFTEDDLYIELDVAVSDNSTYGGDFLNEQIQMYQLAMAHPETMAHFDFTRWLLDIMRRTGVQDPSRMLKPEVQAFIMPTNEAAAFAQSLGGNAVNAAPVPTGGLNDLNLPSGIGGRDGESTP